MHEPTDHDIDAPARRLFLGVVAAGTVATAFAPLARGTEGAPRSTPAALSFAGLEQHNGGRLGVAVLDLHTGRRLAHRADERFPMCSTFKWVLAAQVLARVDRGQEALSRRVRYAASDLVTYSPITERHAGARGMTVDALCEAAVTMSDNTAANLLLRTVSGPAGLTTWLRAQGDAVTRLDRVETALNAATPGDPRDTTTPAAMLATMHRLLLGDVLSPASRALLVRWLVECRTGQTRLRAGWPAHWRVGDKTGSGAHNTTNDVGIAWPPGRKPLLVAAYSTGAEVDASARHSMLADVARIARGA